MRKEYTIITILENGKTLEPITRKTEKGMSDYANRMFSKYGENITVEVYCENSLGMYLFRTYHA